jgi:CDP-paratose synthetase
MKILITGASGYLGSQLVNAFAGDHEVNALVRGCSSTRRITNQSATIVMANNSDELATVFSHVRPDVVINTVALYGRKDESLLELIHANITFPSELLLLSIAHGVKAIIHTGTSLPDDVSRYALTKNTFVKLASSQDLGGLQFINIALEHFYGAGDDDSKFTSYIIRECLKNSDLKLTQGTQKRDFIYIRDVISAYRHVLMNLDKLSNVDTLPLGTGFAPTIREVVELVKSLSLSDSKLDFGVVPMRNNELMLSCADTSRLEALGWECRYSLEAGLRETIEREK